MFSCYSFGTKIHVDSYFCDIYLANVFFKSQILVRDGLFERPFLIEPAHRGKCREVGIEL